MSLVRSLYGRLAAGLITLGVFLAGVFLAQPLCAFAAPANTQPAKISISYIIEPVERPQPLSRLDAISADEGVAGAQLGLADNQTTGRFTSQDFDLAVVRLKPGEDPAAAALAAAGQHYFVVDAPAATLLKMADALAGKDAVLFNVRAADVRLRQEDCRANVLHVAPDRAMLADGLAQYLVTRKWRRWFLLTGVNAGDKAFAEAVRSAARFGGKIVEERVYDTPPGARRSDSGTTVIEKQMPVFTQGAPDHDVVIVADESETFGPHVQYHTWDPRPVAGTSGLVATSWFPAYEEWGSTQLQNRFDRLVDGKRHMLAVDYQAWLAVRAVGEAATRTASADFAAINSFIRSPQFELAGFKGQKLNFRPWNGQLRQPIVLADREQTISVSPQPGFPHRFAVVDTLGIDQPDNKCKLK
jgi:ABC transporter substrate binding protein (PQQ-dependent alcohol dehydrogenase system)